MPLSSAPAAAAASAAPTAAAPTYEDKEAAVAEYENVGKEKEQDAKYKSLQQQWRRMRQHETQDSLDLPAVTDLIQAADELTSQIMQAVNTYRQQLVAQGFTEDEEFTRPLAEMCLELLHTVDRLAIH